MDDINLLTESEVKERMERIANRYASERDKIKDAYSGLTLAEARAQLAVTLMEPGALNNEEARSALKKCIDKGIKMIAADKEAIVLLETQDQRTAYDMAKFQADTSDKEYAKLEPLLSYSQSLMRFTTG